MRALVTGSAGFVGRHFVAELRERGATVHACDIATGWDCLDIFRQTTAYWAVVYDLVVHAAAAEPHRAAIDSGRHLAYNLQLDSAMFDWAARTDQGRVLYLSSCAVLDGPDDYGWSKLTGERMADAARRNGLPVTVVRPYSGYGEDQGENWPFGAFVARAKRRDDPFTIWGDGTQVRDWIHIDDVVRGALAVAGASITEPVSLCTGVGTSMRQVAAMCAEAAGYEPRYDLRADAPAGQPHRVGDPTLLRAVYRPTVDLTEGVKRAIATQTGRP